MTEDFPAVATFGIKDMERGEARARAELASGAVVHLVSKRSGPRGGRPRHPWITLAVDPGYEVGRVSVNDFLKGMAGLLDRVEDGRTFEVFDNVRKVVAYYVTWCPPESLARRPEVLQFYTTSRTGRLLLREFASATAVEAS